MANPARGVLLRWPSAYDDLAGVEARVRAAFGSMTHELGGCIGEMLIAQIYVARVITSGRPAQLQVWALIHSFPRSRRRRGWPCLRAPAISFETRLWPNASTRHSCLARRDSSILGTSVRRGSRLYARQLGLLAQTVGRLAEAVTHLTEAERHVASAGMRAHLARLRYELAGALHARDAIGDYERAATLLEDAHSLAVVARSERAHHAHRRARRRAPERCSGPPNLRLP